MGPYCIPSGQETSASGGLSLFAFATAASSCSCVNRSLVASATAASSSSFVNFSFLQSSRSLGPPVSGASAAVLLVP